MIAMGIELRTECGACGQPLPVNACAERLTCAACTRETVISADEWKLLLEDALGSILDLGDDEDTDSSYFMGGRSFQLMFGRQAPRCGDCKTAVPDEALELSSRGWAACAGCGKRMSLRPAPPPLAALGAVLLVGEDPGQLGGGAKEPVADADASKPVILYCPQCKGPLSVDGSTRMVACQYCSADVYLPDEVWQRLHPAPVVTRWYATLGGEAGIAARALRRFEWSVVDDAVIDADKNIYCVGTGDELGEVALWCIGADLETRWVRKGLKFDSARVRLALDRQGRLLVWQKKKHSLTAVSTADGSDAGTLGGREPDDAKVHHLDLAHGNALEVDVDGTIIALIGHRLVRFSADGAGIATWPPHGLLGKHAERLRPLRNSVGDSTGPYVQHLRNHPTQVFWGAKLRVGWNGELYVQYGPSAACFDRQGQRVYRAQLPAEGFRGDRLASDAAGNLYGLSFLPVEPHLRVLVRVSPDGRQVDTIATDLREGGVLGSEGYLVVAPDGTMFLLDSPMRMRVLAADGSLLQVSDRSREWDAREREEEAARA